MKRYQYDPQELKLIEESCTPFGVYQFIDRRVVTLALSAGFLELFGFENRDEAYALMNHDMYRDAHPDDAARIADAALRFAMKGEEYNVVYRSLRRGEYRIIHAQGRHVHPQPGVRLAMVWYMDEGAYQPGKEQARYMLSDALSTALKDSSACFSQSYDALTGMPSMSYFLELAEAGRRSIHARGEIPAILFIDLTGMKFFNSKHGFAEGDSLIRAVGKLLVAEFSNENCSRLGQDHYAVFCRAEDVTERLERVFAACAEANGGKTLPMRVGIYADRGERVSVSAGLDRAKYACDSTRHRYESCWRFFDDEMLADVRQRQYVIDHVEQAISEGWIQVYYQPIIRAANGKVCEQEALARWQEPGKPLLSPADFVPTLEDALLVYRLDLCVIDLVLSHMRDRMDRGLSVMPTSVNLSRSDFDCCDIVEELRRRVDGAGVPRDRLIVELTESALGYDLAYMESQIRRLQSLGFQVWMDDFGSEYSSLDLLQNVHFDLIKFDTRFMQKLGNSEKGRIILTELVKMSLGLGIETVAEGVEEKDHVEFLKEIGCTKLQGYYYSRPVPPETRSEPTGLDPEADAENPAESDYYSAIGRINLYDLSSVASAEMAAQESFFETLPMAVLEYDGERMTFLRCNQAYREFMRRVFDVDNLGPARSNQTVKDGWGSAFLNTLRRCQRNGDRELVDRLLPNGLNVRSLVRRVAENPLTGAVAYTCVVLDLRDSMSENEWMTFTHIAQALGSDYFNIFSVDLDTEHFVEYSFDPEREQLVEEGRGENFFRVARTNAEERIYEEDREDFLQVFTRERILWAIEDHHAFTATYRLMMDGTPVYVAMKATRVQEGNRIIIGVSNIDARMRQQEALERMRAEEKTYARIMALSGDYIAIYTVDPITDHYMEYSASGDYEQLQLDKEGVDFYADVQRQSVDSISPEDLDLVQTMLRKEVLLTEIARKGSFTMTYRLLLDRKPTYVSLKAVCLTEADGPKLIIGVNNIDAQVRREQEYSNDLRAARDMANRDILTGLRNKRAYAELEERLDQKIKQGEELEFALVVLDLNGLKLMNDNYGHRAGDELLKSAGGMIGRIFSASPAFRVGGDEFVVVCQGYDYSNLEELLAELDRENLEHLASGGAVVARGAGRYEGDPNVAAVFERADAAMYENKKYLKSL